MDRPVINQTTIEGRYDFTLEWTPDEFQFGRAGAVSQLPHIGKPNIFQAFQEQLGLKLESTKAPADFMVIDKAEKPSEKLTDTRTPKGPRGFSIVLKQSNHDCV